MPIKLNFSVRLMNYNWSSWVCVLGARPFPASEKVVDVTLTSMFLMQDAVRVILPELNIQMSILDTNIRFYAPIWLANRSGFTLNFSSAPSTDESLVLASQSSIECFIGGDYLDGKRRSLDILTAESNLSLEDIISFDMNSEDTSIQIQPSDNRIPPHDSADITFEVSLPFNHFDHIDVSLPPSSTASELIRRAISASIFRTRKVSNYVLLYCSRADITMRRVEPSPITEEKFFSKFRSSLKSDVPNKTVDVEDDDETADAVPPKTRFNMSSTCSLDFIPYDTQLMYLKSTKVRVCNLVELALYRQISQLCKTTAEPSKHDLKSRVLKRKRQIFIAPIIPFNGPVPYNPPKLISLIPDSVCVRIDSAKKWSRSISLLSLTFEQISVSTTGININDVEEVYEFGLFSTKGHDLFEMTKVVTFVPRTIFVSLLSIPLMMRHIGYNEMHRELEPKQIHVYHPLQAYSSRLVEVSKAIAEESLNWSGELDINRPGTTFIFLKDTDWLLKANVELRGGSFIITLSEQSGKWPPYVIRNETSFHMRFMQGTSTDVVNRDPGCWLDVPSRSSYPYVWEFPQTLTRCITLQYESLGEWHDVDCIALDETDIFLSHRLKWAVPEVSEQIKESLMMWRSSLESSWSKVYCCLDLDVLYVFKTEKMDELLDVIPLTRQQNGSLKFVSITRLDTRKDLIMQSIRRYSPGIADDVNDHPDSFFDVNVVRVNMLLIADHLSLLDDFELDGKTFGMDSVDDSRLCQLLLHGLTVDVLLKHISKKGIQKDVLYSALVDLKIADCYVEAMELVVDMIQRDLLVAFVPINEMSERLMEDPELFSDTDATVFLSPPPLSIEKRELELNRDIFDDLAFVLSTESSITAFKCYSANEYADWVTTCRQSIEASWIRFMQDERLDESDFTIESFFTTVRLRGKAEGPTKVLEITELAKMDNKDTSYLKYSTHEVSILEHDDSLGGFSIQLSLDSLSVTVMDLEPEELALLRFKDIAINIEQVNGDVPRIATSITVKDIQVDNQLINPVFPLCAYPRRQQKAADEFLQLHGLRHNGSTFPSLHIYFQQKLHFEAGSIAGLISARKNYIELLYFDIAAVWFAPLHIDLEEELLVRFLRLCQRVYEQLRLKGSTRPLAIATIIDEGTLYSAMRDLEKSALKIYLDHESEQSSARGIHFTILHLHPIDVVITFRPSNKFQTTALELSFIAIVAQLNSTRICLNALIVENAFGTAETILDVISRHYMYGIWHQIGLVIGKSDGFEGSVGLLTNIGTGVIDVFYEPIAGLLGKEDGSFLSGLSRGASSLASRTIGGTSAFTSKLTGSIGKGMSLLTLDSDFQHGRAMRRFNRAKNISDGISQGTKGLGQNIVDGVVGVIAEPMKGWETGGAVGLGLGLAKGILGFAFKPAIGVLDLASKTTEGIRNSAFNETFYDVSRDNLLHGRFRVPRTFGPNGEIIPYDSRAAAAQYLADKVTGFDRDNRPKILFHHFLRRSLKGDVKESWGMSIEEFYLLLASIDRVMLCKFKVGDEIKASGIPEDVDIALIWTCPLAVIQDAYTDSHGDLILQVTCNVRTEGGWMEPYPVLHNSSSKDYLNLQILLEKIVGHKLAREQLLVPSDDAMVEYDVVKRFTSGISSIVRAPTKPILMLRGCVLYEYSVITKVKSEAEDDNRNILAIDNFTFKSTQEFLNEGNVMPKKKDYASLSYIYPLVNVISDGFFFEEGGRVSIRLERKDGQSILALKRKDESGSLSETECSGVSFSFRSQADAVRWQGAIRRATVSADSRKMNTTNSYDAIMKTFSKIQRAKSNRSIVHDLEQKINSDSDSTSFVDSISNILVIPTAGSDGVAIEAIKVNILTSIREKK